MKRIIFLVFILSITVLSFAQMKDFALGALSETLGAFQADMSVGSPIKSGDVYLVPLFKAQANTMAMGGGPGNNELWGSFVGGDITFLPYCLIVVDKDGVRMVPLSNEKPFFEQVMDGLPKIMPVVMEVMQMFMVGEAQAMEIPSDESVRVERVVVEQEQKPVEKIEAGEDLESIYLELNEVLSEDENIELNKKALAKVEVLLKTYPEEAQLHAYKGWFNMMLIQTAPPLQQMKMAMDSQNSITTALKLDPDNHLALVANGWMNLHNPMGNVRASITSFEKALSQVSDDMAVRVGLVQAYQKAKMNDKAKQLAQESLDMNPKEGYIEFFNEVLKD